jgi:hypothetical protein
MFEGHRVVAVTPAGRRRYMELLAPQILASALVDRYDIWVNTANPADNAYLAGLAAQYERVRLVPQPDGKAPGVDAIHGFHRHAADADTIYIRFDDDIVWLEPGFFEKLLRFRVDHPQHFLVSPLVINNELCSSILQIQGKIRPWRRIRTDCFDRVGWAQPQFAVALHRLFLDLVRRGQSARLHAGAHAVALNHFSINCICWFGRDLAAFGGTVDEQEEVDLSVVIPMRLSRTNCFYTDTIAVHFAFFSQRAWVDATDILAQHRRSLAERADTARLLAELADVRAAAERTHSGASAEGGMPVRQARRPMRLHTLWRMLAGRHNAAKERNRVYVRAGPRL